MASRFIAKQDEADRIWTSDLSGSESGENGIEGTDGVKIEVLDHAKEDLFDGYLFYKRQGVGVGDYFFDSVSADIESLRIHHGYHRQFYGFHRMLAQVFQFSFITVSKAKRSTLMQSWINEGTQTLSKNCCFDWGKKSDG